MHLWVTDVASKERFTLAEDQVTAAEQFDVPIVAVLHSHYCQCNDPAPLTIVHLDDAPSVEAD